MTVKAHAKINLTLEVLGRRDDGYHDIASVMQTLSLHDELTFTGSPALTLRCDVPDLENEDNLVLRAARALADVTGCNKGADIHLRKGIPVAAGLGGGSSDAAATLLALNDLWELGLSSTGLTEVAADVGSDVAFFLAGGTALVEGRGERVTPLGTPPELHAVLLTPGVVMPNKTGAMYGRLRPEHYSDGSTTAALVEAIRRGQPLTDDQLCNTFESVAFDAYEGLALIRQAMLDAGAPPVRLAGAGPSLFTLAATAAKADDIAARLRSAGMAPMVARTVAPSAQD